MACPAIVLRTDEIQAVLAKAGIKSLPSLGWKLRDQISISTSRRVFLGLTPISSKFVAATLELLKPVGAKFEDCFEIKEEAA